MQIALTSKKVLPWCQKTMFIALIPFRLLNLGCWSHEGSCQPPGYNIPIIILYCSMQQDTTPPLEGKYTGSATWSYGREGLVTLQLRSIPCSNNSHYFLASVMANPKIRYSQQGVRYQQCGYGINTQTTGHQNTTIIGTCNKIYQHMTF